MIIQIQLYAIRKIFGMLQIVIKRTECNTETAIFIARKIISAGDDEEKNLPKRPQSAEQEGRNEDNILLRGCKSCKGEKIGL